MIGNMGRELGSNGDKNGNNGNETGDDAKESVEKPRGRRGKLEGMGTWKGGRNEGELV